MPWWWPFKNRRPVSLQTTKCDWLLYVLRWRDGVVLMVPARTYEEAVSKCGKGSPLKIDGIPNDTKHMIIHHKVEHLVKYANAILAWVNNTPYEELKFNKPVRLLLEAGEEHACFID